jgi:hypothetical protein
MIMNYDVYFVVYDQNGKYIGFTNDEADAKQMATKYSGRYELEFAN